MLDIFENLPEPPVALYFQYKYFDMSNYRYLPQLKLRRHNDEAFTLSGYFPITDHHPNISSAKAHQVTAHFRCHVTNTNMLSAKYTLYQAFKTEKILEVSQQFSAVDLKLLLNKFEEMIKDSLNGAYFGVLIDRLWVND